MAAAAGDAGGPSASVGTSGPACAGPNALVFPSGIGQFDGLLDGGARMICRRPRGGRPGTWSAPCTGSLQVWLPGWCLGSLRFLAVQE